MNCAVLNGAAYTHGVHSIIGLCTFYGIRNHSLGLHTEIFPLFYAMVAWTEGACRCNKNSE